MKYSFPINKHINSHVNHYYRESILYLNAKQQLALRVNDINKMLIYIWKATLKLNYLLLKY